MKTCSVRWTGTRGWAPRATHPLSGWIRASTAIPVPRLERAGASVAESAGGRSRGLPDAGVGYQQPKAADKPTATPAAAPAARARLQLSATSPSFFTARRKIATPLASIQSTNHGQPVGIFRLTRQLKP